MIAADIRRTPGVIPVPLLCHCIRYADASLRSGLHVPDTVLRDANRGSCRCDLLVPADSIRLLRIRPELGHCIRLGHTVVPVRTCCISRGSCCNRQHGHPVRHKVGIRGCSTGCRNAQNQNDNYGKHYRSTVSTRLFFQHSTPRPGIFQLHAIQQQV